MRKLKSILIFISKYRKPIYKNWWLYPLVLLLILFFIFGVPLIINELYKKKSGYITLWEAKDVFAYYSIILSGLITLAALALTLKHNRNMMEKQMLLNRAQVKQPFFIIKDISLYPKNDFLKKDNYWGKSFNITKLINLNEKVTSPTEITLTNIGDGPAVSISYHIEMFHNFAYYQHPFIVSPDSSFKIKYDLQKNIEHLKENIRSINKMQDINVYDFFTNIQILYENILGVKYEQIIQIIVDPKANSPHEIELIISDISPQTIISRQ